MKGKFILAALLLVLAGVQSAWAQNMIIKEEGGEPRVYHLKETEYIIFEESDRIAYNEVYLKLPSGTIWAKENVGARKPEDYGYFFAWGETKPRDSFGWGNYQWMSDGESSWKYINKYTFADGQTEACWYSGDTFIGDDKKELDLPDDAAVVNNGSYWQMPSKEQFDELLDTRLTTTEWTTLNGVNGYKITSKANGSSIFLPAAGYCNSGGISGTGIEGNYWSRSLSDKYSDQAYELFFRSSTITNNGTDRCDGLSVRAVRRDAAFSYKLVSSITLNHSSLDLYNDGIRRLIATVEPSDADTKDVTWESSNTSVATVNSYGIVKANSVGTCKIICRAKDLSGVYAECDLTVSNKPFDIHRYIDLGLTSGTLWATCNVGTSSPEGIGKYYAWGETSTKSSYEDDNYKYWNGYITKYNSEDKLVELLPEDDAATANWNSKWQTPSKEQFEELLNETKTEYDEVNGVPGIRITSYYDDTRSIFLPYTGIYMRSELSGAGLTATYMTRSRQAKLGQAYAYISILQFKSRDYEPYEWVDFNMSYNDRWYGYTVRPVRKQ